MKHILFFISCLAFQTFVAQGYFQKSYGGTFNELNNYSSGMVQHTSDSGYILTHSSLSHGLPNKHALFLVRVHKTGDTAFARSFYLANGDHCYGRAAYQTSDGGFIVATDASSAGMGLLKTDGAGNISWAKSYSQYLEGRHGLLLSNGDYLVVGGNPQAAMLRTDPTGAIKFAKKFIKGSSSGTSSTFYSSYQCQNGDILATGWITEFNPNDRDIFILRLDSAGNIKFAKSYGTTALDEYGLSITEMKDKSIAVTGYCNVTNIGNFDYPLLKVDSAGTLHFYQRIGTNYHQQANKIICDQNNYLLISGVSSYVSGSSTIPSGLILKTYPSGPIVWAKRFDNVEYGSGLLRTKDHGLVLSGTSDKFGSGLDDIVLCKTDSTASNGCNITTETFTVTQETPTVNSQTLTVTSFTAVSTLTYLVTKGTLATTRCSFNPTVNVGMSAVNKMGISVYPNPAGNELFVKLGDGSIHDITLFNIAGQVLLPKVTEHDGMRRLDISLLPEGVYFLNVRSGGESTVIKVMKQ